MSTVPNIPRENQITSARGCYNDVYLSICLQDYTKTPWLIFNKLVGGAEEEPVTFRGTSIEHSEIKIKSLHGPRWRIVLRKSSSVIRIKQKLADREWNSLRKLTVMHIQSCQTAK